MSARISVVGMLTVAILVARPLAADTVILGPLEYRSFADSPFSGVSFADFYLEDFEGNLSFPASPVTTPGVEVSFGASLVEPSLTTDSVDGDDGSIDGSGTDGYSLFTPYDGLLGGIEFTFSAAVLGGLPTHAGIVWTDGYDSIRFEAWDADGTSLGAQTGSHADSFITGETPEDRFYGVTNSDGISRILIQCGILPGGGNAGGGMEVDHLQYGIAHPVPEPTTLAIMSGLLAMGLIGRWWRRRRKAV